MVSKYKTKKSMTKQNNSPTLRFPEFQGEWEVKKLGEIGINVIDGDRGTNYPNVECELRTQLNTKSYTKFEL
jgi:hypothetical protein